MGADGILLKFSGPWRLDVGVDEYFLPTCGSLSLSELMERLGKTFGEASMLHSDGFVCLFDERNGPGALKPEDNIVPGSTLLFLGIVESG